MALEGFQPFVLRTFGGLCTLIDRLSLGVGMSPNCSNVRFDPGTVGSRYAYEIFTEYYPSITTGITAASPIYSIKPYIYPRGERAILYLTSYGATTGTLKARQYWLTGDVTLLTGIGNEAPLTIKADSLLGKLYIAITDGTADAIDSGGSRPGKTRVIVYGGGTTVKQIAPGPPAWKPDATHYVKAVAGAGGLAVGNHYYAWLFQNTDGYITSVGTGGYFNVPDLATTKVEYKNAPIGPPGTSARLLAITAVDDVNLFWSPDKTVFWDNTTHTGSLTVSEDELLSLGEPVRPYATLHTPSAPEGVISYADRVGIWGSRDKAETSPFILPAALGTPSFTTIGLPNLDFKSGYSPDTATMPGYWVALGAGSTGFALGANKDTLLITSPTINHGISVTGTIDSTYIRPGSVPNIRVKARWGGAGVGQVTVSLVIKDTSGTPVAVSPSIDFTPSASYTDYRVFTSANTTALTALGPPPILGASATVTVQCTLGFAPGNTLEIDWIEIYDRSDYLWANTVRWSRARDPESFDYATGVQTIAPDEGERVRACFRLRDACYIAKDRSLYVTRDTGEEPVAWPIDLVDRQSGTPSPHGIGYGDGWVVIATMNGLVLFDGATPQLISQEITPTWNTINWGDPCTAWVVVDLANKQIKIGARKLLTAAGTGNDLLLCLDYVEGFGNPIPSGQGRKWSIDTVDSTKAGTVSAYHQGVIATDPYGAVWPIYSMSATPSSGTTPDTGTQMNVVTYQATARNDFPDTQKVGEGVIRSTYETAPIGEDVGRTTFDKLVMRARGSGYLYPSYVKPDGNTTPVLPSIPNSYVQVTSAPEHDVEVGSNLQMTSVGVRIQMFNRSDWFSLRRLAVFLKNATYGFLRGKTDHTSS